MTNVISFTQKLSKLPYIIKHIASRKADLELGVEDVRRTFIPANGLEGYPIVKILYCVTKYDYENPRRGFSVEEISFYHTLCNMPVDVYRFDPVDIRRKYGRKALQDILLNSVSWISPDVVFLEIPSLYEMETIEEISRNTTSQTINWACDDHWAFDRITSRWIPKLNWAVTTDPNALEKGQRLGFKHIILTTWACNHVLFKPMKIRKRYDVTFIGQVYGIRGDIIEKLNSDGIKLNVFGYGTAGGRLSFRQMIQVINESKICINFCGGSEGSTLQTKARVFEVSGCGTFCLSEYLGDIENHYRIDDEIVCWNSYKDLREKIGYYLENKDIREEIALAGLNRTLRQHTYVHRFCDIFDKTLTNKSFRLREQCKSLGLLSG